MTDTSKSNEHIVVVIHGIRTHASWAEMVKSTVLSMARVNRVFIIRYGFLDLLSFLFPFFTRRPSIKRITRELRDIRRENPNSKISVIAHSFGTYALYRILYEETDIRLYRVILCGSIIPEGFSRARCGYSLTDLGSDEILNDCGTHDIWPVLAKSITWGYGATGTFGFGTQGIRDRFNKFGHGDYFDKEFVQKYWVNYLRSGKIISTDWEEKRTTPPYWHSLVAWFPTRWLVFALVVIGIGGAAYASIQYCCVVQEKVLKFYSSNISIEGSLDECTAAQCRIIFREAAYLIAPNGQRATYEGRIMTSGKIKILESEPNLQILNPNQFPGNPGFAHFRIEPKSEQQNVLQAFGEAVIEQKVTPNGGKIGPHFPYFTEYAVVTLDLSRLQFGLNGPVDFKIESPSAAGVLVTGYYSPRIRYTDNGKWIVLSATNLPANSSLYITWGPKK